MNLQRLLLFNAALTFAAAVVLIVAPTVIPSTVGVYLDSSAFLLAYLLGASELALSTLSYFGRRLDDAEALRLITVTCVVFHISSALVEFYAFAQDLAGAAVWANILLRLIVCALFAYYGFYKTSDKSTVT